MYTFLYSIDQSNNLKIFILLPYRGALQLTFKFELITIKMYPLQNAHKC